MTSESDSTECAGPGVEIGQPPKHSQSTGDNSRKTLEAIQERHDRLRKSAEPTKLLESSPSRRELSPSLVPPPAKFKPMRLRNERIAEQRVEVVQRWHNTGVPDRHRDRAWQFRGPKCWVEARDRIVRSLGSGFLMVLVGQRGPGKTQLAVDACRSCVELGREARYTKAIELLMEFRRGHNECEGQVFVPYLRCRLLVIDELQVRSETGFEDRMLVHLIDKRYDGCVDTLLVANLTASEFERTMGSSVAGRMRETGGVIYCDWESFR